MLRASHPPDFRQTGSGMGRRRLLVAYSAIAVVVLGHLRDIVTDAEHWPFSPYPMYSYPPPDRLDVYRVVGVVEGGAGSPGEEFPLTERRYLRPLDARTLSAAMSRLDKRPGREQALDEALCACLARYDALRRGGRHDGPPLHGARLYRLSWPATGPGAGGGPERRQLLHEVFPRDRT